MDNQHRLIKTCRDLSTEEICLVNESKELEQTVLAFIEKLSKKNIEGVVGIDMRWLSIGLTNIEQGFMAVNRSITKPSKA